jgi:hypothetical protein
VYQVPGRWKIHTQYYSEGRYRRDNFGDLGVDVSTILKRIWNK